MKNIDISNKHIAIDIATQAFIDNPSMNWFLNKSENKHKAMKSLCEYCIDIAMKKSGAFITDDLCCICLINKSNARLSWLSELRLNYFFIQRCCGWINLWQVLKRSKAMKKIRGHEEHLYAFLLASNLKNGNQSVLEAKSFMFEMSRQLQLPIYAETCLRKNKNIYLRYGFKPYTEWNIPNSSTVLWFLKKSV